MACIDLVTAPSSQLTPPPHLPHPAPPHTLSHGSPAPSQTYTTRRCSQQTYHHTPHRHTRCHTDPPHSHRPTQHSRAVSRHTTTPRAPPHTLSHKSPAPSQTYTTQRCSQQTYHHTTPHRHTRCHTDPPHHHRPTQHSRAAVFEKTWGNSKKRKKSCFLDFEKKNIKNVKKRTGRPTQPVVSQAT